MNISEDTTITTMTIIGVAELRKAFEGIPAEYKQILVGENKAKLSECIKKINDITQSDLAGQNELVPPADLLFNAFRMCPAHKLRVVIIGQDPYPTPGDAHGLSFSVPRGRSIPPSLRNIYAALYSSAQINAAPKHGCLENWAKQGILLLNTALTTKVKSPNAHKFWADYTCAIIDTLTKQYTGLIFLLWGGNARVVEKYINKAGNHITLVWGHPSPLSTVNSDPNNPAAFINCDHFSRVNEILSARGETVINWDPDIIPAQQQVQRQVEQQAQRQVNKRSVIYMGTDGGATANGKPNCKASWAFVLRAGVIPADISKEELAVDFIENFEPTTAHENSGPVEQVNVAGMEYTASNNMGELTSILMGLSYIRAEKIPGDIVVVSDSKYAINSVDVWIRGWLQDQEKHRLDEKKNLHLILPIKDAIDELRKSERKVTFIHIRGHRDPPLDTSSIEWFLWSLNDQADKLCQKVLL